MAFVVDGKALAQTREQALKTKVGELKNKGMIPRLVSVVLKDDASGQLYTRLKKEAADRIGVHFVVETVTMFSTDELLPVIEKYSKNPKINGIIIQRPGGKWRASHNLDRTKFEADWNLLVSLIDPQKDVDGLRPDSHFTMATVKAVETILDEVVNYLKVRNLNPKTVVVGSQGLVGRILVKKLGATGVDLETKDLKQITRKADILISATGEPNLIRADMVKDQAIVVDVGWPKADVDFAEVSKIASVITPVPGGVGPLTVVSLLENLLEAYTIGP